MTEGLLHDFMEERGELRRACHPCPPISTLLVAAMLLRQPLEDFFRQAVRPWPLSQDHRPVVEVQPLPPGNHFTFCGHTRNSPQETQNLGLLHPMARHAELSESKRGTVHM